MIHQILLLALLSLIQTNLSAWIQFTCDDDNGNYTTTAAYGANLHTTLSSLSTNIDADGFYNASTGQGSDRVNAVALCRGDLQTNACRSCVRNAAAEIVKSCPNRKQAVLWEEYCMLRYSNATIYGVMSDYPSDYWWYTDNVTSPEKFMADLRVLMDDLRRKAAAGSSLRKVAAGNATGRDFQVVFGLVQCTPDLSSDDCASCLIGVISKIPYCCAGKVGGSAMKPSCNLRFGNSPFFNETRIQELEQPPSPPSPPPQLSRGKNNGKTTGTIIIIMVAVGACLTLVVSVIIFRRKKQKQKPTKHPETVDEISSAESVQYAFNTIKAATNDFSLDNRLGQGGFGTVYKGKFPNGEEIAVKRLSMDSRQGDMEFKNEVVLLAKLQHKNLVKLLGFALEGMEKLLVYEFLQNSSLDNFIFEILVFDEWFGYVYPIYGYDNLIVTLAYTVTELVDQWTHSCLDWDTRYKIIGGIARGILYLHEDSRLRIIHRDLKASNVLLDGEMNPKIADFGTARLFGQDETQASTNLVVGTYGYMPPEYIKHGRFSLKSDVFSFGVLVLEIISGKKNNNFGSWENVEDLLSFTWKNWREGTAANVVDPLLRSGSGSMNKMLRCIHIGLLCVQENSGDRPTMASVVTMLTSSSTNLVRPSQPAFYHPSLDASDVYLLDHYDLKRPADQSDYSSHNDVSISVLHPR